MSKPDITVTGGEIPAVDPTFGIPAPEIASSAAEIKEHQTEGSTETTEKPSFDYESAATRAAGEW